MEIERRKGKAWEIAVIAAIALGVAAYVASVARNTGIPVCEELAVLNHGKAQADFRMPHAKGLYLLLALEKGTADFDEKTRPEGRIAGEVVIREGTNVAIRLPVELAELQPCNWLARDGFGLSYILNWNAPQALAKTLFPRRVYRVEAELQGVTNANASLWIYCLVANKDRKSATEMKVQETAPQSNASR